jgi:hypothetical protein
MVGIFLIIGIIFYGRGNSNERTEDSVQIEEYGIFTYEIASETGVYEDQYVPDEFDGVESAEYYVAFANLELCYDFIPLEGLRHICDDTAYFLNLHGYSEVHMLTVDADSIINDKSYPLFECSMEGVEDVKLEIRYNLEKAEFEFKII